MAVVALLVVLALVIGGTGLIVEGLKWLLILAVLFLVAGAVLGARTRSRGESTTSGSPTV